MNRLSWLTAAALALICSACQCGNTINRCDAICTTGTHCDESGRCVADGAGGGGSSSTGGGTASGGGTATGGGVATGGGTSTGGGTGTGGGGAAMGTCTPTCTGNKPVCDPGSNTCVTCNASSGCFGSTPFCDTSAPGGQCVGCRGQADCTGVNQYCDQITHTCQMYSGTGGGSGSGGGTGTGGGFTNVVVFDDAGMTQACLGFDAGTTQCTNECGRGFECVNGQCVLRGSTGPIQVTLRFNQPEDLDLHVEEPVDAGTQCDIFYGAPNAPPDGGYIPFPCGSLPHCAANEICINNMCVALPNQGCGAYGWLDLDSNPACNIDNVDIENIIYSPGNPVHTGQYIVRVDYYAQCSATGPVPYEVEVRALGQTRYYCGQFMPGQSDSGGANSGVTIASFDIH